MTWQPIPQHPDYDASDDGRIRSRKRRRPKLITLVVNDRGYVQCVLYKDGKAVCEQVHRLVLMAFVGAPPTPRHEANHKDWDKRNNRSNNLEWVTPEYNREHGLYNPRWAIEIADRTLRAVT